MDESLKKFYESLQPDIQFYFVEEYVKPQLIYDEMINEFHRRIETEECQRLGFNAGSYKNHQQ